MYEMTLAVHNLLRWVVVLTGLAAVIGAAGGLASRRDYTPGDAATGRWFSLAVDAQFLVGLLLYAGLSPYVRTALSDMAAAMKDASLRYWAVEHAMTMILTLGLVHIGRARVKRTRGLAAHRAALIFFGLALALVALGAPWPWSTQARPWMRF